MDLLRMLHVCIEIGLGLLSMGIGLLIDSEATNGRALTGAAKTDNMAMTDEACVNYCISKNYNFAGVEYASECCKSLRKPSVILFTCLP